MSEFRLLMEQFAAVEKLHEGYREVNELGRLADAVIYFFAKKNAGLLKRLLDKGEKYFYFDHPVADLEDCDLGDRSNYPQLNEFIKSSKLRILFKILQNDFSGVYTRGSFPTISLNINDAGFRDRIYTQVADLKIYGYDDGNIMNRDLEWFHSALKDAHLSSLIHELQHAYDDFNSGGKYATDTKSKEYYDRQKQWLVGNKGIPAKERVLYLMLPHEYWARFAQTVSIIGKFGKRDWSWLMASFKWQLEGYELLSDVHKKRLIKAFYKYCVLHELIAKN